MFSISHLLFLEFVIFWFFCTDLFNSALQYIILDKKTNAWEEREKHTRPLTSQSQTYEYTQSDLNWGIHTIACMIYHTNPICYSFRPRSGNNKTKKNKNKNWKMFVQIISSWAIFVLLRVLGECWNLYGSLFFCGRNASVCAQFLHICIMYFSPLYHCYSGYE